MNSIKPTTIEINKIKREICISLNLDPETPPLSLNDKDTSKVLGVVRGTLSVWRCTKRYCLPFTKIGANVRYPLDELAKFIILRTYTHTGET